METVAVPGTVCLKNEGNRSVLSTGGRSGSNAGPSLHTESAPDPLPDTEPKSWVSALPSLAKLGSGFEACNLNLPLQMFSVTLW